MAKPKNKERFAGQHQNAPQMQVMSNGGVNDAVNFAVQDFYKAELVLRRCTDDLQTPYDDLPPGVRSFVGQQFFRMNAAGQMLDALGYQGVTEVLAVVYRPAVTYIEVTMAGWNEVIAKEGEVQKIWETIAEEEKKAGIGSMQ